MKTVKNELEQRNQHANDCKKLHYSYVHLMKLQVEDGTNRTVAAFNNDEVLADLQDSKIEQLMVSMLDQVFNSFQPRQRLILAG